MKTTESFRKNCGYYRTFSYPYKKSVKPDELGKSFQG